ncbi:MAG: pyrimidine 5'-nucleotidase [Duodenibacillus sp.]|nr:pyrimidine 5'-nucleotidase [Duodenibacillus sp.]
MLPARRKKVSPFASALRARASLGTPRLWLFDMDNTLYNASAYMFEKIHALMQSFIARRLNVTTEQARALQYDYWSKYGATFKGLQRHHHISPEEFLTETHRFDVACGVKTRLPKTLMRRTITRLPGKKVLLTNGPKDYAETILKTLHLQGVFETVKTSNQMQCLGKWRCKPDKTLLSVVAAQAQVKPEHVVLVEDSLANLKAAKALGMKTVWCIGYHRARMERFYRPSFVDVVIEDIAELNALVTRNR